MTNDELTHERCSELLGDFAGGTLDGADAARVEEHLRNCAGCSDELRALSALRVEADAPLTDLERARILQGVRREMREVIPARPRPSRTQSRLAAALGVAALLAIIAVGIVSIGLGGGGDDAGTQAGGGALRGQSEADTGADTGAGQGAAADAAAPVQPQPSFNRNAGRLTAGKLSKIGKGNATLTSFSNAYTARDADRLRDRFVGTLASLAGPVEDLVRTCAQTVYENRRVAALPAYAARGRLEGREALVLGFAWTDEESGPLDQFMLWTWSQTSCDDIIDYRAGPIAPRK